MNKIKKNLIIAISILSVATYIYFPIFCFVKKIEVQGNQYISSEEIVHTSEIQGKLFYVLNKEEVEVKLKSIKIIDEIKFEQINLRKLRINIKEKKILMVGYVADKKGYIDSKFNFITGIDSYLVGIDFPIFTSDSKENLRIGGEILELITKETSFSKEEISEIKYDEIIGFSVFTSKNTHIYFGKGNYKSKVKNLKKILDDYSKKKLSPSFIDISNIRKGVVKSNL